MGAPEAIQALARTPTKLRSWDDAESTYFVARGVPVVQEGLRTHNWPLSHIYDTPGPAIDACLELRKTYPDAIVIHRQSV